MRLMLYLAAAILLLPTIHTIHYVFFAIPFTWWDGFLLLASICQFVGALAAVGFAIFATDHELGL